MAVAAASLAGGLIFASHASAGPPDDESLVANINPAGANSSPAELTTVGNTVFFAANDGTHGVELFKSDGMTASLVKDINPTGLMGVNSSNPEGLAAMGGILYFKADDGTNGPELWRSDGTEAGTTMVKDIWPNANPGAPVSLTPIGDTLFFSANDGTVAGRRLWKSNGTEAGTEAVALPPEGAANPSGLTNVGGSVFFAAVGSGGTELYRSDGASTNRVSDINAGGAGSDPDNITAFDGKAFFRATDGTAGVELWKSDGTTATLVKDINETGLMGVNPSNPSGLTPVGDTLFFRADDGVHGRELWKSNGTGASLVADTNPGGGVAPVELINLNGTLLYQGSDGAGVGKHGVELWRSDGTEAGTAMVKDINPGTGDSYPSMPAKVGGYVVFAATATGLSPVNSELWRTDGTAAGTAIVEDINPGAGGLDTSPPPRFAVLGSAVLFNADDGTSGVELWKAADTIPPQTTIDSGPAEGQNIVAGSPTFAFSSDDPPSGFQCSVDGAGFAACASPQSTAALGVGAHSFAVRATDAAGNVDPSPATRSFTVKGPPETTIDSGPAEGASTTDTTPTFGFSSEPGATFECRLDGGAFAACISPNTTGELSLGAHTFSVRATDSLAQTDATPATRTFTVTQTTPPADKDPPQTTIDKQPKAKTTKRKAKFSVSSSEPGSTFECRLDKAGFEPCGSSEKFKVKPGRHRAEFRAIDAAGNVDPTPAVAKWKVKRAR